MNKENETKDGRKNIVSLLGSRLKKGTSNGRMSLVSHLAEFRRRLVICFAAFIAAMLFCFSWAERLVNRMMELATGFQFVYITPTELLMSYVRVAMIGGVVLAFPIIIYQIWKFIRPGLLKNERRATLIVLFMGLILFCLGVFFAFRIVLPLVLLFFAGLNTGSVIQAMVSVESYIGFVVSMLVTFGVVFELPVVTALLTKIGLLNPMFMSKNRKYVLLIILVVGALITPPDVTSQILVAAPMYVLFEASIVLCRILFRKKLKMQKEECAGETDGV